ncbi:hypothetical protein Y032_0037g3459 [Ancylostoma ceylanicum]|uniref:Uncharacterized protein n=1 Tax=Ancylostoma ceylanicum TaxID=53326 RepID=A0A016UJF0_9BILA|nr:hypothetical protein Y032_0037g3459 [Ancylostoma ceylanicum]
MSRARRYAIQGNDHISLQGSPLSPWNSSQQQSLHDIRTANSIRVGPGSYRVLAPKIPSSVATAVSRILKPTSSCETPQDLQEAGTSLAADIAYFKRATMGEKRAPRKRVYFPDLPSEDLTSKKTVRIVKGGSEKYHDATPISLDKSLPDPKSSETIVVDGDGDEQSEILLEPAIDVEGYEEVTVTEEYDDGSGALNDPYLVLESRDVISGSSLRELKGENSYLKEQLHASVLRVKQLEALLLERNTHVKNLVSENLQLSIKCRKLMNALGEEETREAL